MARFSVSDACGGIPPQDLPRVFDVAFRGEAARTPGPQEGAGLGLTIARGIVEAHSGQIAVRNAGPGCQFLIRLPLARRACPPSTAPCPRRTGAHTGPVPAAHSGPMPAAHTGPIPSIPAAHSGPMPAAHTGPIPTTGSVPAAPPGPRGPRVGRTGPRRPRPAPGPPHL